MDTLTMQAIADLAQVRRPVVSTWRHRHEGTAHPFPDPVPGAGLRFDVDEVSRWLDATGLGNNPQAPLEAYLHSSRLDALVDDPEVASALLLLHHVTGEVLAELAADPESSSSFLTSALPRSILDPQAVPGLLAGHAMVAAVDELVEAAFAASVILDRLLQRLLDSDSAATGQALSTAGNGLIVALVSSLMDAGRARVDPVGLGAELVAARLAAELDDGQGSFGVSEAGLSSSLSTVAWRAITGHAGVDAVESAELPSTGRIVLHVVASTDEAVASLDLIEEILRGLAPRDAAVIAGPSALLIDELRDEHASRRRRDLLVPPAGDDATPLRYVARLPRGLGRGGDRRRMALWVLGDGASALREERWTVYGEHGDADLDGATCSAIAADAAAAVSGGTALIHHAFLRSSRAATRRFLVRDSLTLTPAAEPEPPGGETLARIWELDDGLLGPELTLTAQGRPDVDPSVSWEAITRDHAREIRGTQIPTDIVRAPGTGTAAVIGPAEVRDPRRLDERAVDRLTLEIVAPRSTVTRAGDVVFTAEGGPAAIVDHEGGRVLEAPARILRPRSEAHRGRQLHASVAARDIAAQTGRDRRTWRLRTVPADAVKPLDRAAHLTGQRRRELHRLLADLDELDLALFSSLAAGTLAARLNDPQET